MIVLTFSLSFFCLLFFMEVRSEISSGRFNGVNLKINQGCMGIGDTFSLIIICV